MLNQSLPAADAFVLRKVQNEVFCRNGNMFEQKLKNLDLFRDKLNVIRSKLAIGRTKNIFVVLLFYLNIK